jgi:2-hydroxychromene-2-carboxylate isomerase
MKARRVVEFFYGSSSAWDYLAFVRLVEAAMRTQSTIVYRPVLARALPARGAEGPEVVSPAAATYAAKDLQDWARFCGVRITPGLAALADADWAQRGAVAVAAGAAPLPGPHACRAYVEGIFRARFTDGRDIADRAVVVEVAACCGIAGPEFESVLDSATTLDALHANAHELVRRGGYATPTMLRGDDMYVGHACMPLLESALMRASDRPFVAPGEHDRA